MDQVGNWANRQLDLNNDSVFSGPGELDDTGTFNDANEWLTRNTDSSGGVEYTLTHDANGNLTDIGDSGGMRAFTTPSVACGG